MSARKEKKHMSDQVTSSGASDASAATAGPTTSVGSSGNPAPVGAFGAKGSGLARGKRPSPQAAPAASTAPSGYQPSALEVLRPQSEYKNPFTGETSVPVVNEPAAQAAPTPTPTPIAAPTPIAPIARTAPAPAPNEPEMFPFAAEPATKLRSATPEQRAEINILPTEEVKRPAVSWGESNPPHAAEQRPRRDDRPAFRPERRDQRPSDPREPRQPRPAGEQREPREPRRDFNNDPRRREERSERPAITEPVKKPTGFFAWLKALFSSSKTETNVAERPEAGNEEHLRHHRRRHRGGRGRGGYQGGQGGYQGGGENRGPRDGQPRDQNFEGNRPQPDGEQSSDGQNYEGGGRRRRRGGRGRYRDDRGPRPEGQQGGGAI